jgi:hypothetical protein
VQILPRKVTRITQGIIFISITVWFIRVLRASIYLKLCRTRLWRVYLIPSKLSASGMTGFPSSSLCFPYLVNIILKKIISFPSHFPSEIQVYRPPHAYRTSGIEKITSCDDLFAALSSNGELFIFNAPKASQAGDTAGIKPQRVWALRKKFTSVKVCRITWRP